MKMYRFICLAFIIFLNSCQEPITNSNFCYEDDIDRAIHFLDVCNPEGYSMWSTKAPLAQCQAFSKCLSKAAKNSYPDFLKNFPEQSISSYEDARVFIEHEKKIKGGFLYLETDDDDKGPIEADDKGRIVAGVNNTCGELVSSYDLNQQIWWGYDVKWEEAAEINDYISGNYNRCMCYLTNMRGLTNWSHFDDVACKDGKVIRESAFPW